MGTAGVSSGGGPVVPIRFKVLKTGTSGWQGMILSARTLDVAAPAISFTCNLAVNAITIGMHDGDEVPG